MNVKLVNQCPLVSLGFESSI